MSLARLIASGFGSGYAPKAPGTAGSLVAAVVGAALLWLSPWALLAAALLASVGGIWAIRAAKVGNDPGWVVIDEFAGQWIALLGLSSASPFGVALAFALFRLFDITKPGPVGWADRQHGPVAVMADDVIAGALAAALLLIAQIVRPGLLD